MFNKSWSFEKHIHFVLACVIGACIPSVASAQQTTPDVSATQPGNAPATSGQDQKPDHPANQPKDTEPKAMGTPVPESTATGDNKTGTSNDRLLFALPNFLTLQNAGKVPPLTTGQKFKVVARGNFDYVQYAWVAFLSGIAQAENSEPGYGQGWEGYGKRYASHFADNTIENFMTGAILPSLLHQDPRFFQSGRGGFVHRGFYAASRILVTRTDSGGSQFNTSEGLGSALSAAISTNTYHPKAFITKRFDPTTNTIVYVHNESDRTLSNTLSVWGTQVAYDTITIVIKEFWPDIQRKVSHKHSAEAAQPSNH